MRVIFLFLSLLIFLASCLNNEKEKIANSPDPDFIYYDYRVQADEEKQAVTVMLQYRFGGEDGENLLLEKPSKASLDGIELTPDSAKQTGVFYELMKPLQSFSGKHSIVFTDSRRKEHRVDFSFEAFSLANELPEQIAKKPFIIQLANFPNRQSRVHLVMIDTSYTTMDVNEEVLVEDGKIPINAEMLANLSSGPITLEILKEEDKPLKNASREGGRLLISYGIRREFELVE
ncbi:MAG: hypothetical protein EOO10_10175 [Chitinophagaceae bacterium]|nr:MAG: hypothetical protein EOO10_10175 [Chitinophagaceae bacterium]